MWNKMSLIGICSLRITYFGGVMRLLPFMFGIICIGIIGISTPAGAAVQNNPWWAKRAGSARFVGSIRNIGPCPDLGDRDRRQ
jgi:hypothetical protein